MNTSSNAGYNKYNNHIYGGEPLSLKEKKLHKEIMRERFEGDDYEPFNYAEHARSELRTSEEDKVINARMDIVEYKRNKRGSTRRNKWDRYCDE